MTCEWRNRVAELEEGPEIEYHLSLCPDCRQLRTGLLADLQELVAGHEEPLAAAHYTAVRARVWSELQSSRRRKMWNWLWAGGSVVMVVAALARAPGPPAVAPPPALVRLPGPPPAALPSALPVAKRHVQPHRPGARLPAAPVMVKLLTDDPNVVIYWIMDQHGG